jgi:hypothetical protein
MILTAATQTMTNKTLTSPAVNTPTIVGGSINQTPIGQTLGGEAAGTFTNLSATTTATLPGTNPGDLTVTGFTTGILHSNSTGDVSSSLIVNADVDAAAALAFSKLASLSSGNILVGSNTGVPTSRAVTGDVTIDNLGATTIGATKVLNSMLAGSIDRSKLLAGTAYRILANSSAGVVSENAALTANEAVATDANGQLTSVTGVSATELGYLSGVTSDVQSQINAKQASDATLTAVAGVTTAADKYIYFDGVDTAQAGTITSFGRSLVDDADAATSRSTLGLGSLATQAASSVTITGGSITGITDLAVADGGTGASTAGGALTNLGAAATAGKLSQFAATTSSELAGVISDETGSGSLVFATSPSITTPTLDTPVIDNGATFLHETTPSTPSAGRVRVYPKSDNSLYVLDSSGVETQVGSGSSAGGGTLNIVDNPSAAATTTGWTAATNYTVSRDVANSPLAGIIDSCFAISTTTASSEASTSGVYAAALAMPAALRNTKTQLSMYVNVPASSLGVWRVSIYNSSGTRMSLSSDSAGATTLAAGFNGQFVCTFDANSSATYTISLTQTTRTSANTLYATNISIGNGITAQGAVVSETQTWTTTLSAAGNAVAYLEYERVGSNLVGRGTIIIGSSLPTGTINFTLPSGLNASFTRFPKGATNSDAYQRVGYASSYSSGGKSYFGAIQRNNTSTTEFQVSGSGATYGTNQDWSTTAPVTWANGDAIMINCTIPIAEWAGNGTVNLGAGAQVEYAANSGTWDADVTLSGFVYGPAGVQMGGALTGSRIKRVKFQYPIQSDDEFTLEFSSQANGPFQSAPTFADTSGLNVFPFVFAATAAADPAGCEIRRVSGSTTDLDIVFAKRSWARGDASAYRDWQSTWYWRVRKAKAGAAVGFGMAGTDGSAGLYKAGQAPGSTSGAAIPAGYVGEMFGTLRSGTNGFTYTTRTTTALNTTPTSLVSFTLNKGVYLIGGFSNITGSGTSVLRFRLYIGGTQTVVSSASTLATSANPNSAYMPMVPVVVSADSTAVALFGFVDAGTATGEHEGWCIRIA